MPRVEEPMKDVVGCDKPRSGANSRYEPGISEWGNLLCITERPASAGWAPGEVKYLSTLRKRNRKRFP